MQHLTTFLFVIFALMGPSHAAHHMGPQLQDYIYQKERSNEEKREENIPSGDCEGFTAKYRQMGLKKSEIAQELYVDAFKKSFENTPSALELAEMLARCSSALANNGDNRWPIEKNGFLR